MRKIYLLRSIVNFLLYFSVISGFGLIIFMIMILFDTEFNWDIPININGITTVPNSVESKITFIASGICYLLFVYAIFLFKKTTDLFIKGKLFDNQVIKYLSQIGKIFVIVSLAQNILYFIIRVTFKNSLELNISSGFDSFLFTISIGIFFIILSEIFKISKRLKEENELTI